MTEINLKEIFTDEELEKFYRELGVEDADEDIETPTPVGFNVLKKPQGFKKYKKINSFLFDRTQFILKVLKSSKEKLQSFKETSLAKALNWLTKELDESVLFKSDDSTMINLEKLKKENQDLHTIFSWLEEYSMIKIKQNENIAKVKLRNYFGDKKKMPNIPLTAVKDYLGSDSSPEDNDIETVASDQKFINFSEDCISSIETSNFDIFRLENEVGQENTLSTISCYIFSSMGFYSIIKYDKFEHFIQAITKGYLRSNSYHNDLHAADVLQTCMIYLKKGNIKDTLKLDDLDQCALLISCIIHDFRHPGVTNGFLINAGDQIAIKYNDVSVLENFHVAEAFKLITTNNNFNIFCDMRKEEYKVIRKRIVESVLATDMTFHAKQLTYLKAKTETFAIKAGNGSDKIVSGLDNIGLYTTQQEFMNILIHASDISNPTKPFGLYKQWAVRCMNEFWEQGDKEKSLNLPVSFLCDRTTTTLHDSQLGFIDGIVTPFTTVLVEIFPGLNYLIDSINDNRSQFKKIKDEFLAKKEEATQK